ncbi:MAG: hypothetical protein AAB403_05855, partial [Planctomycetota bacterium]
GIDGFRRDLIAELIATGHEVLGLEIARLGYVVPRFEEVALKRLAAFRPIPWRRADLLHVKRLPGVKPLTIPELEKVVIETFARSPHEFRVFVRGSQLLDPRVVLDRVEAYSTNVSTRAHTGQPPDLWTTEKVGAHLGQLAAVRDVLAVWQDLGVRSATEAIARVAERIESDVAKNVVSELDRHLAV